MIYRNKSNGQKVNFHDCQPIHPWPHSLSECYADYVRKKNAKRRNGKA